MAGIPKSFSPSPVQAADTEQSKPPVDTPADKHEVTCGGEATTASEKSSVYAALGWLDRLLVLWILLAIIIGILLGNFVDGIGPALQRGKFVDVSVPIGEGSTSKSWRVWN
jgi:arsenite transporter